ncbi:hypothetical protein SK128_006267 [Halocaridina rubra]|uniref:Oplophorus-luciferin 2-monooxygenase non-catalytic subunit n=1 Tax=Halocaridina rubra TaxID=373956 RepID=A0AAN8WTE9_HALRR
MASKGIALLSVFLVLVVPSQAQECPAAEDILPCSCNVDENNHVKLDCSDVTGEEELASIMAKEFPSNEVFSLMIQYNMNLKTLKTTTLADKIFTEIHIQAGGLESVDAGACLGSVSTLKKMDFRTNKLTVYPFDEIPQYTSLLQLRLGGNLFETFPHISSPTLEFLDLHGHDFGAIPDGALSDLPSLEILFIYRAGLTEIPFETFEGTTKLRDIDISYNEISRIEGLTMHGDDSYIIADHNQIVSSGLSANSFTGVKDYVSMWNNLVDVFDEATWRPLLEGGARLDITDNPLKCDCTIAWLVLNGTLMNQLAYEPTCSNGAPIFMLDPSLFEDC